MNEDRMTPEAIAEIRVRAEAATPGAWRDDRRADGVPAVHNGKVRICDTYRADGQSVLNAEFIAHAREDIPALLAEVERLRTAEESLAVENARFARELEAAKRRGKWNMIRGDYGHFYTGECSECGCQPLRNFAHSPWTFCPNCGAKMGFSANAPSPGDGERGGGEG